MALLSLPRPPVRISASLVAHAISLFAFAGNCPGSDMRPAVTIPRFNSPFAIIIADLNGDGFPDIAAAVTYVAGPPPHPGFVSVFLQNPEAPGKFFAGVHYSAGTDPLALAADDLNGDGLPDLAVANLGTPSNLNPAMSRCCFKTPHIPGVCGAGPIIRLPPGH